MICVIGAYKIKSLKAQSVCAISRIINQHFSGNVDMKFGQAYNKSKS